MPSGAMICMTTDGLKYLAPFCLKKRNFQSGSCFQRHGYFPSDFTLAKNRTSNKYTKAIQRSLVLLRPRGRIPHFFCCQMFKIFEFKKAELKDYVENTEADPNFIFCLICDFKKNVCCFFLYKVQHD